MYINNSEQLNCTSTRYCTTMLFQLRSIEERGALNQTTAGHHPPQQPTQRGATSSGYSEYRPEPWATSKRLDTGIQGQSWMQSWIQAPCLVAIPAEHDLWWQSRRLAWMALLVLAACEWWPRLLPQHARTPMRSPVALAC